MTQKPRIICTDMLVHLSLLKYRALSHIHSLIHSLMNGDYNRVMDIIMSWIHITLTRVCAEFSLASSHINLDAINIFAPRVRKLEFRDRLLSMMMMTMTVPESVIIVSPRAIQRRRRRLEKTSFTVVDLSLYIFISYHTRI